MAASLWPIPSLPTSNLRSWARGLFCAASDRGYSPLPHSCGKGEVVLFCLIAFPPFYGPRNNCCQTGRAAPPSVLLRTSFCSSECAPPRLVILSGAAARTVFRLFFSRAVASGARHNVSGLRPGWLRPADLTVKCHSEVTAEESVCRRLCHRFFAYAQNDKMTSARSPPLLSMTPPLEAPLFFASAKSVNGLCSRLTQSCTQRTGKPYAR